MLPLLLVPALLGQSLNYRVAVVPGTPAAPFEKYQATDVMPGRLAQPRISTSEERQFATVLRDAIVHGWGVVDGGTEHERKGANFNGRYVLVQWGCGSNCMRAALIDGRDGTVLKLPHSNRDETTGFDLATGSADLRTLEFRWNSALLGVPRVADGKTYYYRLSDGRWIFVNKKQTPPGHD